MSSSDTPYDPKLSAGMASSFEVEDDDWDEAPITPRVRVPRPTKLLLVLMVAAAAFAGGVFAQRHWGPAREAALLRPRAPRVAAPAAAPAARSGAGRRGSAAERGGSATGFGGATIGQVAYLKGTTLYITDTSGNTIKVIVPKGTPVTKSVSTGLNGVGPGDTVVVRGLPGPNGTATAQSVSVGAAGAGFGGGAAGSVARASVAARVPAPAVRPGSAARRARAGRPALAAPAVRGSMRKSRTPLGGLHAAHQCRLAWRQGFQPCHRAIRPCCLVHALPDKHRYFASSL